MSWNLTEDKVTVYKHGGEMTWQELEDRLAAYGVPRDTIRGIYLDGVTIYNCPLIPSLGISADVTPKLFGKKLRDSFIANCTFSVEGKKP